jgi:signal transduction histidine kinase
MMRGRSLSFRLAVLLAGVLVVVLLLAGVVMNRAASRSLDETLGPRQQERLNLAGAFIEEGIRRGLPPRGLQQLIRRVATDIDGVVRVVDDAGSVLAESGRLPRGAETERLSTSLAADVGGGALEIEVRSPTAGFLRAFNATLLWTGVVAVLALLGAAALVASRVTRPLRDVTVAARRLEAGDLGARATGGSDAESAELADAFNGMAERLERSEELRRRAASDLAHDLATPATVLESQIQAMVDGVVPADAAQLEKARAAATSLSGLVGQLGELTQAEAATLQRTPERLALRSVALEIVDSLESLLRDRGVLATVGGEEAPVLADRGQLTRAVRNVVTNAVQHAPSGSEVTIEATPGALRITDRGPGIAAEDLPFVFERFYRADRSRGRQSGSGIGLTVARELIGANGGRIEVEGTGPTGTTFRITLPPA